MSQYVAGATKSFVADEAAAIYLRMKFDADGKVTIAGASDADIGTLCTPSFAALDVVTVRLRTAEGTSKMVAVDAITCGNPVYAAAAGKISASGSVLVGEALEASTADNDVIEVLRVGESSAVAAAGGTTAAAFLVDSDATTPKIELAAQTGGTGDFKASVKPPATLTANRVFTLPGDFAGVIDTNYTFPGTPAATATAGNAILVGCHQVVVGTVTNDANDWMTLPAIASVAIGESIVIACNAGGNFELRTPASSNTTINGQDCDGTKEYLCTDTDVVVVTKATTTNWIGVSYTSLGAVRTAVVPD